MSAPLSTHKPIKVVIIGAGVAGLAVAYGLNQPAVAGRFDVRVIEKRSGGSLVFADADGREKLSASWLSYTHLTSAKSLLTPADQHQLYLARQSLPARHDGISFYNSKCKRIWHTLREPFESSMVERGDLLHILRDGAGDIEYERKVVSMKENAEGGAIVLLSGGEIVEADILIAIRKTIHPIDDFHPMPWVTCNFRLSDSLISEVGADPLGISVFYGRGWSGAVMPIADGAYVALTVPAPVSDVATALAALPDAPLIRAIRNDKSAGEGHAFPLYSATTAKVGRGRVVLIGDSAHGMIPFCGAGASMALNDAAKLVKLLTGGDGEFGLGLADVKDLDKALPAFHKSLKKTADPMIKMSKFLLWLAQGKTRKDRVTRGLTFRTIELLSSVLPIRRRLQKRLDKVVAEEALADRAEYAESP